MRSKSKIFNRFTALILIMVLIMSFIVRRLVTLQILNGETAKVKADSSSIRDLTEPAPRGEILDKNGETLASSIASYDLVYNETKESSERFYETVANMLSLLNVTGENFNDKFALRLNEKNEFFFDFKSQDKDIIRLRELRWKKDRGMDDFLVKGDFGKSIGKNTLNELNDEERKKLDELLLSITPEGTFNYLIKHYSLYGILMLPKAENRELGKKSAEEITQRVLKVYSKDLMRKFMVVKDEVNMKLYQSDKSVKLSSNMKKESAFVFLQKSNLLPGVKVQMNPIRIYPYGTLACHVLGYLSPINEFSQSGYESMGYDINNDLVGTYGVEKAFEKELKGNKTISTVKIDRQGRTIQELFKLEGYPGNFLKLSIDKDLQYTAEMALNDVLKDLQTNFDHGEGKSSKNATRGAVIVQEVKTGKIIALASHPVFDPNVFVVPGNLTPELYKKYFSPNYEDFGNHIIENLGIEKTVDELFPKDSKGNRVDYYDLYPKPFLNYATQGLSPVGSIFKPFTSLAGLEEEVFNEGTVITDLGTYERKDLSGYKASNNDKKAWGDIDYNFATMVSSNYYFLEIGYRLYKKLGLDAIAKWSWLLGLGHNPEEGVHSTTGIEIEENVFGGVYSFENKKLYLAAYSYSIMNGILLRGVSRTGEKFRPIDISIKSTDSDKIKKIKSDLKTDLSKWFKEIPKSGRSQKDMYAQVIQILGPAFNKIMEDIPQKDKSKYESSTYYANEVANQLIFDKIGELTTPVNVLNSAIGQGDSQLTLIQLSNAMATILNGGTRYRTSVVDSILDPDGNVIKSIKPEVLEKLDITGSSVMAIKKGMYEVNNNPSGGGYKYFNEAGNKFPIKTAGKTGTAEFTTNKGQNEYVGRHYYGTYLSFAPYEDPEIVVAIIVYDSVHGAYTIDITRAIYEKYFEKRIKEMNPEYKNKYDYLLKPVVKVEPSLLKLKNKDPYLAEPQTKDYKPGMDLPPYINPNSSNTLNPEGEEENNDNTTKLQN